MRIYLAAAFGAHAVMRERRDLLVSLGYEVTSAWMNLEDREPPPDLPANSPEAAVVAERDLAEVKAAEVLILSTEPTVVGVRRKRWAGFRRAFGLSREVVGIRGGREVEFGYALGLGRTAVVVGPAVNVFHSRSGVYRFPNWDTFVAECLSGQRGTLSLPRYRC